MKAKNGRYTKEYRKQQIIGVLEDCELSTREVSEAIECAHVSAGKLLNDLYAEGILEKRNREKKPKGREKMWKIKGRQLRPTEESETEKLKHARWV